MYEDINQQTYLIDTELCRPNFAACYLIQDSNELALVDCGTAYSLPTILQAIKAIGCRPEQVRWIIPTHVHLDHAGGAGHLMQHCPNAQLVVHPKGLPHMIDPSKLQAGATAVYGEAAFSRDYDQLLPIDADRCIAAENGQNLALGGRSLTFIYTAGHANHHGCIHDDKSGYLFTGDTFGLAYRELAENTPYIIATTSPVAFDPEAWFGSLERMMALEPSAVCLTHYGKYDDPSTLLPQLLSSIQAHQQIALNEEENATEGRQERLLKAVENLLITGAQKHTGLAQKSLIELLKGDVTLNAQGLEIWLARRAKRRSQAN